MNEHSTLILEL